MSGQFYTPSYKRKQPKLKLVGSRKHYWGEKGKNYGFYTTPDEEEMDSRRVRHRRIRSQTKEYENPTFRSNQIRLDGSKRTMRTETSDQHFQTFQRRLDRSYVTTGVQYDEDLVGKKEVGVQAVFNVKEKLQSCLEKLERLKMQQKQQNTISQQRLRLPEVHHYSQSLKKSRGKQPFTNQHRLLRFASQSKVSPKESNPEKVGPKQSVVYYHKPNRLNNPTYCNSLAYPLPCYRYLY